MVSHLLLLPWCTAITGYWIGSNNSNSQQQPTSGYKQTSKSLLDASQPTRVKTTTSRIYAWESEDVNTMPAVLCTNSGFVWGYVMPSTSTCRKKKHHPMCHMKFGLIYINFISTILYTICDWICEKGSYMRNYKYLEIQFWNIQFKISRE